MKRNVLPGFRMTMGFTLLYLGLIVILPLMYCDERDLAAFARERRFPILPCNLCGSQTEAQRKQMKALIADLETKNPSVRASMLAALSNVVPSHLLDPSLTANAVTAGRTEPKSGARSGMSVRAQEAMPSPAELVPAAMLLPRVR